MELQYNTVYLVCVLLAIHQHDVEELVKLYGGICLTTGFFLVEVLECKRHGCFLDLRAVLKQSVEVKAPEPALAAPLSVPSSPTALENQPWSLGRW